MGVEAAWRLSSSGPDGRAGKAWVSLSSGRLSRQSRRARLPPSPPPSSHQSTHAMSPSVSTGKPALTFPSGLPLASESPNAKGHDLPREFGRLARRAHSRRASPAGLADMVVLVLHYSQCVHAPPDRSARGTADGHPRSRDRQVSSTIHSSSAWLGDPCFTMLTCICACSPCLLQGRLCVHVEPNHPSARRGGSV